MREQFAIALFAISGAFAAAYFLIAFIASPMLRNYERCGTVFLCKDQRYSAAFDRCLSWVKASDQTQRVYHACEIIATETTHE